MARFAKGSRALAISDRSGAAFPYREMVKEWTGSWVHNSEFEAKQPQLEPHPVGADPQGLLHARPARVEFSVLDILQYNPFQTYQVVSAIVNVSLPGNGYTTGDVKRFRGSPTTAGEFNTPLGVGGITGSTIAKAAGYTITVGKFINGATNTDGSNGTDWFYFSADTNATSVVNGGGGFPVSVGPVTLEA